jgi:hypothetical protein
MTTLRRSTILVVLLLWRALAHADAMEIELAEAEDDMFAGHLESATSGAMSAARAFLHAKRPGPALVACSIAYYAVASQAGGLERFDGFVTELRSYGADSPAFTRGFIDRVRAFRAGTPDEGAAALRSSAAAFAAAGEWTPFEQGVLEFEQAFNYSLLKDVPLATARWADARAHFAQAGAVRWVTWVDGAMAQTYSPERAEEAQATFAGIAASFAEQHAPYFEAVALRNRGQALSMLLARDEAILLFRAARARFASAQRWPDASLTCIFELTASRLERDDGGAEGISLEACIGIIRRLPEGAQRVMLLDEVMRRPSGPRQWSAFAVGANSRAIDTLEPVPLSPAERSAFEQDARYGQEIVAEARRVSPGFDVTPARVTLIKSCGYLGRWQEVDSDAIDVIPRLGLYSDKLTQADLGAILELRGLHLASRGEYVRACNDFASAAKALETAEFFGDSQLDYRRAARSCERGAGMTGTTGRLERSQRAITPDAASLLDRAGTYYDASRRIGAWTGDDLGAVERLGWIRLHAWRGLDRDLVARARELVDLWIKSPHRLREYRTIPSSRQLLEEVERDLPTTEYALIAEVSCLLGQRHLALDGGFAETNAAFQRCLRAARGAGLDTLVVTAQTGIIKASELPQK